MEWKRALTSGDLNQVKGSTIDNQIMTSFPTSLRSTARDRSHVGAGSDCMY